MARRVALAGATSLPAPPARLSVLAPPARPRGLCSDAVPGPRRPSADSPPPTVPYGLTRVRLARPLPLQLGGTLEHVDVAYAEYGPRQGRPTVMILPSLSHSGHVTRNLKPHAPHHAGAAAAAAAAPKGWWEAVVGAGSHFGINTEHFHVVCASPLGRRPPRAVSLALNAARAGAPFGSTSPLSINERTGHPFRSSFPQITPADQVTLGRPNARRAGSEPRLHRRACIATCSTIWASTRSTE